MSTAATDTALEFVPVLYWHESVHPTCPFSGVAIHQRGGAPSKVHCSSLAEVERHAEWNGLKLEQVESREVLRAIESLGRCCCELTLERARELAANIAAAG